jgi:hypothetical protein
VRTALGDEVLRARGGRLAQRARNVLFLVDGRRTAGEIVTQLTALPKVAGILDELQRDGYLTQKVHDIPSQPILSAAKPAATDDVYQAIRGLNQYLEDAFGPEAYVLSVRLESARTGSEFVVATRRAMTALKHSFGLNRANQFQARAQIVYDTHFKK